MRIYRYIITIIYIYMNLIEGDCLIELKKMKDKSVDFVYLDLPYGQTACSWDKKIDLKALWIELKRIARNDRTPFFFSCTTRFGFDLIEANKKWFRWDLVWKKNRAAGFLNAYKLPMRKHEMVYCFAKKSPAYDVSSHKEFIDIPNGRKTPKNEIYGQSKINDSEKTNRYYKIPLPTSDITPPTDEHELVYCFAKKTPEYDVSSHLTGEEKIGDSKNNVYLKEFQSRGQDPEYYNKEHIKKVVKEPLPTSIIPPTDEHELVYCFAKKTPEYDVSSHKEYTVEGDRTGQTHNSETYAKKGQKCFSSKTHKEPLPTSEILLEEEQPSSWCEFDLDTKTGHRTAKPIKLMEFLLKYWSKEGQTVLDPTAGSGSMGIACKNMKRNFIGIEKDPKIFKLMEKRIADIKE